MKSHQETFNDVVRGLAAQDFRRAVMERWDHPVTCAYRNEKGDKCAVGVLLPEDTPEVAWFIAQNAGYVEWLTKKY